MKIDLGKLLIEKMMSEEGENAFYLANVLKDYSQGGWTKKKMELALKMVAPKLSELAKFYDMEPTQLKQISKKSGVPISKLSFLCMLLDPLRYFPMDSETIQLSEKIGIKHDNYDHFLDE